MKLSTRTLICNILSRLTSYFNWTFPLRVEPVGLKRWMLQKKELAWDEAIDGEQVLKLCPELSREDLAALIQRQIKNEHAGLPPIFGRPYVLLNRNNTEGVGELTVIVALPVTSTPHIIYRFGVKDFDFSKVYFERDNVQKYLATYASTPLLPTASSGKAPGANLDYWEQTIEEGTKLLAKLYEGQQAPVTKDEARKLVEANKRAFEAWWRHVPDKFKAGIPDSLKKQ